jgi:hypothetical protein
MCAAHPLSILLTNSAIDQHPNVSSQPRLQLSSLPPMLNSQPHPAHSARSPLGQNSVTSPLSPYTSTPISAAFASELQRLPHLTGQKGSGVSHTPSQSSYAPSVASFTQQHMGQQQISPASGSGIFNFFDTSLPPSSAQLQAHMQSSVQSIPRLPTHPAIPQAGGTSSGYQVASSPLLSSGSGQQAASSNSNSVPSPTSSGTGPTREDIEMGQAYDWNFDRVFVEATTPTPLASTSTSHPGVGSAVISGSGGRNSGAGGGGHGAMEGNRTGTASTGSAVSTSDDPNADAPAGFSMDATDLEGVMGLQNYGTMAENPGAATNWERHHRQDLFGPEWKY